MAGKATADNMSREEPREDGDEKGPLTRPDAAGVQDECGTSESMRPVLAPPRLLGSPGARPNTGAIVGHLRPRARHIPARAALVSC